MKNLTIPETAVKRSSSPDLSTSQQRLNQQTLLRYERLSFFQREEIQQWIKNNFSQIPMLSKTKKAGVERLSIGDIEFQATLVIIRYTVTFPAPCWGSFQPI